MLLENHRIKVKFLFFKCSVTRRIRILPQAKDIYFYLRRFASELEFCGRLIYAPSTNSSVRQVDKTMPPQMEDMCSGIVAEQNKRTPGIVRMTGESEVHR